MVRDRGLSACEPKAVGGLNLTSQAEGERGKGEEEEGEARETQDTRLSTRAVEVDVRRCRRVEGQMRATVDSRLSSARASS